MSFLFGLSTPYRSAPGALGGAPIRPAIPDDDVKTRTARPAAVVRRWRCASRKAAISDDSRSASREGSRRWSGVYRRSELARAADAGLRPSDDRRRPALQSGQCETDRRDPSFKAREGRPRIPLGDAPATFRQLSALASASSGLARTALEAWLLMIATAARPSEALEARWQEVNLDKKLWTLPAADEVIARTRRAAQFDRARGP